MKDKLVIHKGLEVCSSVKHGYGVFTTTKISSGSIVEECMCCIQTIPLSTQILNEYRFSGPKILMQGEETPTIKYHVIPTGFGMVYNHSHKPNMEWVHDVDNRLVVFKAVRDIQAYEELTHDYGPSFKQHTKK